LADTISFLRWYARTAGSLLRRTNFSVETLCQGTLLYGFCHFCSISLVPFSYDDNWGTKVTTYRAPCR
jgi:hypothetical protein